MNITYNNKTFEIEDKLANSINGWVDAIIKYNQDMVIVFDGAEGAGKSTLMRQVGAYVQLYLKNKYNIDRPFNLDNIHFDLDAYTSTSISKEKEKGWIHDLDESRAVANRKRSTSKGNVSFTNYLSECRSAGHIHLIALPAYHDLDSYIAIWRCSFLIHIDKFFKIVDHSPEGVPIYDLILGTYRVFLNDEKLKAMYYHKMKYIYPRKEVFTGKFSSEPIIDEEAYEEKKREARAKRYEDEKNPKSEKKEKTIKYQIFEYKAKNPNATNPQIAKELECDRKYVHDVLGKSKTSSSK